MNSVERLLNNKKLRVAIIIIMTFLAAVSIVQGVRNAVGVSQDFQWDASRALLERIDPYELSLDSSIPIQSESLKEFYCLFTDAGLKQKMEANQFPSLLVLLFPYAIMPPFVARIAWIISNILFTAGIIWLLRRTFFKNLALFEFLFVVLLMLMGTPFRNQLGVGQHTLFSFFFFLLAVWLDESNPKGNHVLITVCLAICFFKYTLTAPLCLFILYRRRIREFVFAVIIHIGMTVGVALWLQKNVFYMITAPLKVASVLSSEGGLDLGALFNGSSLAFVIGGIIAIMLVLVAVKMPKGQDALLFSLLLLWSLVITYHRTYDFFVMSAVPIISLTNDNKRLINSAIVKVTPVIYWITTGLVYFGLRIFDESDGSKIVVGLVYYSFTILITYISIKNIYGSRED